MTDSPSNSVKPLTKLYADYDLGTGDQQIPEYKRWMRTEGAVNELARNLNAAIDRINTQQEQIDELATTLDVLDTQNLLLNERIAKYEEHTHIQNVTDSYDEDDTLLWEATGTPVQMDKNGPHL